MLGIRGTLLGEVGLTVLGCCDHSARMLADMKQGKAPIAPAEKPQKTTKRRKRAR